MATPTTEGFIGLYGFPPQEYFNRIVLADAAGKKVKELEAKIAEAEKELEANTPGNPGDWTSDLIQKHAYYETQVTESKALLAGDKARQAAARKFIAGELDSYLPFLGEEGNMLYNAGLIDPTVPPAS